MTYLVTRHRGPGTRQDWLRVRKPSSPGLGPCGLRPFCFYLPWLCHTCSGVVGCRGMLSRKAGEGSRGLPNTPQIWVSGHNDSSSYYLTEEFCLFFFKLSPLDCKEMKPVDPKRKSTRNIRWKD